MTETPRLLARIGDVVLQIVAFACGAMIAAPFFLILTAPFTG